MQEDIRKTGEDRNAANSVLLLLLTIFLTVIVLVGTPNSLNAKLKLTIRFLFHRTASLCVTSTSKQTGLYHKGDNGPKKCVKLF